MKAVNEDFQSLNERICTSSGLKNQHEKCEPQTLVKENQPKLVAKNVFTHLSLRTENSSRITWKGAQSSGPQVPHLCSLSLSFLSKNIRISP